MCEAEAKVQHFHVFQGTSKPQKIRCWFCNNRTGARMEKILSVMEGFAGNFKSPQGNPVAVFSMGNYNPVQSH